MIDFKEMEYGAIMTKKGVVLVINGAFHGPFKGNKIKLISDMLENDGKSTTEEIINDRYNEYLNECNQKGVSPKSKKSWYQE